MHKKTIQVTPQPDENTCGPSCLHALYTFYGHEITLEEIIAEIPQLEEGGTLGVFLACHALKRGFRVKIFTYNLHIFDPSWFDHEGVDLYNKLEERKRQMDYAKLKLACHAYRQFLDLGGQVRFEDLNQRLIRKYLDRSIPILTGLSATYLYRSPREYESHPDDVRGEPVGHFVVLHRFRQRGKTIAIADPLTDNPFHAGYYDVGIDRVIASILLGIVTYDANLLIIEPGNHPG